MAYKILIWVMRFVLLGIIYAFLYRVIKIMYMDLKGKSKGRGVSAGVEVVKSDEESTIAIGMVYPLHPHTVIGRAEDNAIVLESQFVSNHHASIDLKNNYYILKDLGSTNGTHLNGEKIEKPMVINNDDMIDIGGIVFKVIG